MNGQKSQFESLRSVAGFVLVGPGLFLLSAHVITAVSQLSRFLNQTASVKLELVSSIMLVASLSRQHLAYDMVCTLWPVVLVLVGSAFLRESPKDNTEPCMGCA
jgi:uncharacterized membrane protein